MMEPDCPTDPERSLLKHPARVAALLLCLFAFAPSPAHAQEGPTSAARYFPPSGLFSKEFTLVREDGWFHIFYLRDNIIPGAPTQQSFGHAISRDLYTWAEQDTILPVVPGTFEATQMWAPTLHKIDGTWYLFYPGMRDEPALGYHIAQTMTYATSPDLFTWTRRTTPLFDNTIFPWAYVDSTLPTGRDCRDPFLQWDAAHGEWLLYVSARPASRPQSMVIGIAGSTDLETWTDRGMMPLSLPNVSFSDIAESPHVMSRDDSLFLIQWTTDAGQSLTFGRSTDLVTGWNTSRRLRAMLGYSTSGWWGSEMLQDGDRVYFGNVHNGWVDFWDATWTAPDTFTLDHPDPFQLLSARFTPDRAAPGDTVTLDILAVHALDRTVAITLTKRDAGWATPVAPAEFGLGDTLVLTGDSTSIPCVLPATTDGRSFLVDLVARAGTSVGDTLAYVAPLDTLLGPPDLPQPEPPPVRVVRLQRGVLRFVRNRAGTEPFVIDVRDARGRRVWRGEAGASARSLDWRTDGGAGGERVSAGVYFARVPAGAGSGPATLKVVVLP
jgi:hypothetical protein